MQAYCLALDVYLLDYFCFYELPCIKKYTELPLMGFQIEAKDYVSFLILPVLPKSKYAICIISVLGLQKVQIHAHFTDQEIQLMYTLCLFYPPRLYS